MIYFKKEGVMMKKNSMRLVMLLVGAAVSLVNPMAVQAQATQTEGLERGSGVVSQKQTARKLAEQLLASKGWVEGLNKKSNGGEFYITIGTGDIQAPLDHPNYLDSRANAYDKAMMDAWGKVRKFVGETIQADASSYYKEATGEAPSDAKEKTATQTKLEALLNGALDKALTKVGVDPASATPEQKEKALTSDTFKKSAATAASGPIVGIQSFASFEGPGSGKGYQIAVVAIWSDKLQKLAESMLYGTEAPAGASGKPVQEWIPSDDAQLISSFGVQMVRDESGNPVLLAYGQSRPVTESSRSVDAAYEKAFLEAKSMLRFFAGAQAKILDDLQKSESTDEYADGTKEYNSANVFEQSMNVYAPPAKFAGIARIKTWTSIHPLTQKQMVGAVAVWSPESALVASGMGAKMEAPPKNLASSKPVAPPAPARPSLEASDKGLTGAGAAGSEDF
jgi:hypothetical protein